MTRVSARRAASTRRSSRRAAAVAALATLVLAGCGAAERNQRGTSASAADRVVVEIQPEGPQGQTVRRTISCTSVTEQCRKLRAADFDPPAATACTQIFGGPAVATVTGKAGGEAVDAEFNLTNGCQIDRWREFSWLLGGPPGQ